MSVPTAAGAETPIPATKKGVISETPPTPVRPTRKPTSRPKRVGVASNMLDPVKLRDGTEVALPLQEPDDPGGALRRFFLIGLDVELGGDGGLVRVRDARELRDLAAKGLLVEALDVPVRAYVERRVHEDLYKAITDVAPDLVPYFLKRRDGRDDDAHPVAREKIRHEPDPAHVRVPGLAR